MSDTRYILKCDLQTGSLKILDNLQKVPSVIANISFSSELKPEIIESFNAIVEKLNLLYEENVALQKRISLLERSAFEKNSPSCLSDRNIIACDILLAKSDELANAIIEGNVKSDNISKKVRFLSEIFPNFNMSGWNPENEEEFLTLLKVIRQIKT